jgi:diguanylate cyclase (GGDEF)-like protein
VQSTSVFHSARPSARAGVDRFAVVASLVVVAFVAAGSAAFLLGGGVPVALATGGVLLFAMGAASCSLVHRDMRRRSQAGLHALIDLGRELETIRRTDDLAVVLARHARRLGFERVLVLTRADDRWEGAVVTGLSGVLAAGPVEIGPLAERVWRTGAPKRVRSLEGDAALDELLPSASNVVVVPLIADGEAIGVVFAEWDHGARARIPALAVDTLAQSAIQAAVALRNAALLGEVEHLATRDGLTGLANRRLFEETLSRELARSYRRRAPLSLTVIDVDQFKDVNDTAGHQAGDEVLRQVGAAFVANTKSSDLAARYGGDEFVVLLPDCSGADALRVAERLGAAVAREVTVVLVTVSAGVGEVPGSAGDCEQLVTAADTALYAAKHQGRNRSVRSDRVAEPGELAAHPSFLRLHTPERGREADGPAPGDLVRPAENRVEDPTRASAASEGS